MQVDWATIQAYMAHHPRWFENAGRRPAGHEHLLVYRSLVPGTWQVSRRGYWIITQPPGVPPVAQGWKLHVSATSATSTDILRAALPVLRDARVHFKFLMDPVAMREHNDKLVSRGASGKFITVYPADEEEFRAVGDALTRALDGFDGPHILSDRRYPGSRVVFYRYGGFTTISRVMPDGNRELLIRTPEGEPVPDVRHPYFHTPDWVSDPFRNDSVPAAEETGGTEARRITLAQGRFTVTGAMQFSNRGGLYRAEDNETGADVLLREARPGVQVGPDGLDAAEVLRHEFDILTELADTGHFVRPVACFTEGEHTFVAEEFIEGSHVGLLNTTHNPLYTLELTPEKLTDYYDRFRGLWLQIAEAIAACHERGIVLGDLSPTNIMVTPDDRVRIIDMEAAFHEDAPLGAASGSGVFTPGMVTRRARRARRGDRATDYYALGGIMLGGVVLCHQSDIIDPTIPRRVFAAAAAELNLPADLVALITELYDENADAPDPAALRRRLEELPLTSHWRQPPPLALPATPDPVATADLRKRVGAVLDGVHGYWRATADLTRADRLFPSDLTVFETSPLTLAYGAYGTLYAMHRVRGSVPEDLLGWALRQTTSPEAVPPGLYHGSAGIAWAQSALGHRELAAQTLRDAAGHPQLYTEPGVLAGAAGHGMACLRLWKDTGLPEFLDRAREIGDRLALTADRADGLASWPSSDGVTRVGYGVGASGVALFLLALHGATGDAEHLTLGRQALDFDLAQATFQASGLYSFPAQVVAEGETAAVVRHYWDSGTAGVLTALLRYHHVTQDPALRRRITELLPDIRRKFTVLPQLFHGTSGLGNTLLDAYEFLGDPELLADAERLAESVLCTAIERSEGIVFPGEQAVRESADLATGSAGVALFLDRLCRAEPGARTNANFVLDDLLPEAAGSGQDRAPSR
ncbi:class III lanthionine synthetase LanKC [Streptomyces otsuchiensis]|uniref:class III lanthionine synthetase LanKC n=1 Tax=Streptomyces otsuchiensis TaxID=2681388 RepID=UPI0010323C96|nr:class III lanthionine synthetase LanKC [Streptomyces otsuchiensis]